MVAFHVRIARGRCHSKSVFDPDGRRLQNRNRRSWIDLWALFGLMLLVTACGVSKEEGIASVYALAADESPESIDKIRKLTSHEDRDIRSTAIFELAHLNVEDAPSFVRKGLQDEDSFVRATSARCLGDVGTQEDVARLAAVLAGDPVKIVRKRAAEALTLLGGADAVDALVGALEDPMTKVRLAAIKGVARLEPGAGFAPLSRLLLEDPEWEVRVQAAGVLGSTGDEAALPILALAEQDPNEMVRAAAAAAQRAING